MNTPPGLTIHSVFGGLGPAPPASALAGPGVGTATTASWRGAQPRVRGKEARRRGGGGRVHPAVRRTFRRAESASLSPCRRLSQSTICPRRKCEAVIAIQLRLVVGKRRVRFRSLPALLRRTPHLLPNGDELVAQDLHLLQLALQLLHRQMRSRQAPCTDHTNISQVPHRDRAWRVQRQWGNKKTESSRWRLCTSSAANFPHARLPDAESLRSALPSSVFLRTEDAIQRETQLTLFSSEIGDYLGPVRAESLSVTSHTEIPLREQ